MCSVTLLYLLHVIHNVSNLVYNLILLWNRKVCLLSRTIYSVALLLQLVVKVHCCVAQYVTRSSTIWTAWRNMFPTCMVRHVAHLYVPCVAAPWRTRTVCMLIYITITRGGLQLTVLFRIEFSLIVINIIKLKLYIYCVEQPKVPVSHIKLFNFNVAPLMIIVLRMTINNAICC
jgi:hypothetical protein